MKSFESSQAENKTYSIHVDGSLRGSEKVPGEGTSKRFQVPGGGKVKSREGKMFSRPPPHTHTGTIRGNLKTLHRDPSVFPTAASARPPAAGNKIMDPYVKIRTPYPFVSA